MKAAFINQTGTPDVIQYGDLADPTPGPGEVLVQVRAVAVNPIDLSIRAGTVAMTLPKPFVIGCDLAGVVKAVGPQASRFKVGDRVWGSNQGLLGRQGTFAEYAAVAEEWLYPIPAGVSDNAAVAAPWWASRLMSGLFRCANLQAGETVFVNGGTGGVGSAVVLMARATARASSPPSAAPIRPPWSLVGCRLRAQLQDRRRIAARVRGVHRRAGHPCLV